MNCDKTWCWLLNAEWKKEKLDIISDKNDENALLVAQTRLLEKYEPTTQSIHSVSFLTKWTIRLFSACVRREVLRRDLNLNERSLVTNRTNRNKLSGTKSHAAGMLHLIIVALFTALTLVVDFAGPTSAQTASPASPPSANCDLTDCASLLPPPLGNPARWYKCDENPQLCIATDCRCDGNANCPGGGEGSFPITIL